MISVRLPPTFMPTTPSSQPLMTWPPPSAKENGRPLSLELSNFLPSLSQPVWWTTAVLPVTASAPVPSVSSVYLSPSANVTSLPPLPPPAVAPPQPTRNPARATRSNRNSARIPLQYRPQAWRTLDRRQRLYDTGATMTTTPEVSAGQDLFAPALLEDPYPWYTQLRATEGAYFLPPNQPDVRVPVLSRYADVQLVLRDPRFGRAGFQKGAIMALGDGPLATSYSLWMLFRDPPDHTRLRGLVNKAFTPRAVEAMRKTIDSIVADLLAKQHGEVSFDLISQFAYPLPVMVICELLGVPAQDRNRFGEWSSALGRNFDNLGIADQDLKRRGNEAAEGLTEYFRELVKSRRGKPAEAERLRKNPSLLPNAVEELLRYDSPVQRTGRTVLTDVEVGGRLLHQGERVNVMVGAANRDPAQFSDPDRLDVTRSNAAQHLSFAAGIHYCVGAPLARLEAQLAIGALLRAAPNLRLATDKPEWRATFVLRGMSSLPVAIS